MHSFATAGLNLNPGQKSGAHLPVRTLRQVKRSTANIVAALVLVAVFIAGLVVIVLVSLRFLPV